MKRRQDTCIKERCPFWKRYGTSCPNYVEGEWVTTENERYSTRDCAPKRSMILNQQIYDALIDTRKDYGQVRKAMVDVMTLAAYNGGVDFIEGTVEEVKQIEDKTDGQDTVQ